MKGNKGTIVFINAGSGNDRTPQITTDIIDDSIRIAFIRFGIDIKAFFVFPVAAGFYRFKGRADLSFHFIEKCSAESVAQESVIKVMDITPETIVAVTAFGNEAMDMRVPFQVSAKSVKDHDETGSEVHGFV